MNNMKTNIFLNKKISVLRCLLLATGCMLLMQGKAQSDKRLKMAIYIMHPEIILRLPDYGQFLQTARSSKYQSDFPLNVKRNIGRIGQYERKQLFFISRLKVIAWQTIGQKQPTYINNALKKIQ